MNTENIKAVLQELIYRLQDAEKGYQEIKAASSHVILNKWLELYSKERHNMHRELEALSKELGGDPVVDTTILGAIHRMFIDIKINNVSFENEIPAIVDEIERGATTLLNDYTKALADNKMDPKFATTLFNHKVTIQTELDSLIKLREEINNPVPTK